MTPILKYPGGKRLEIKHFAGLIPSFDSYIEPFLGGGAVFFYLEPQKAFINDLNTPLMHFYREVKENYPKIEAELQSLYQIWTRNKAQFLTGQSPIDSNEGLYYTLREQLNQENYSSYSYGTLFYALNKLSFSAIRFNAKGENNVPYGHRLSFAQVLEPKHSLLLKKAQITNQDYAALFRKATAKDFIFLDPPYDTRFTSYGNHVDFKEAEQRRLVEDFKNLGTKALMIIGKTPLTMELYKDFVYSTYEKRYAQNFGKQGKDSSSPATHLIISNYLRRSS